MTDPEIIQDVLKGNKDNFRSISQAVLAGFFMPIIVATVLIHLPVSVFIGTINLPVKLSFRNFTKRFALGEFFL